MRGIAELADGFVVVWALLNAVAPELSKLNMRCSSSNPDGRRVAGEFLGYANIIDLPMHSCELKS
jgi:hypothetical protein